MKLKKKEKEKMKRQIEKNVLTLGNLNNILDKNLVTDTLGVYVIGVCTSSFSTFKFSFLT